MSQEAAADTMSPPVRKGYAQTPWGQVHFRQVEGAGPPVLMFHRTPSSSESFERMLGLMRGRRAAIAFDTPGFGQSFRPAGAPGVQDYAHWLLAAADDLGVDRFHLCGHHSGAHIAVELALQAPRRSLSLTLNGVLYLDAPERQARRARIGSALRIAQDGSHMARTWDIISGLFPVYEPDLVHAEVMGALAAMDGRDQAFSAIYAQDLGEALRRISCPTRIVQSHDDPLSAMLDRIRAAHPAIPVTIIGPAGLAAPERQADSFTQALCDFAAANDPAG